MRLTKEEALHLNWGAYPEGCIMLDIDNFPVVEFVEDGESDLYVSETSEFVKGATAEIEAHATLIYGTVETGKSLRFFGGKALDGWEVPKTGVIESVGFFESAPRSEEKYYTIVGHILLDEGLREGRERAERLMYYSDFDDYKPHVTLAYVKHDPVIRDKWVQALTNKYAGSGVKFNGIDFGK